jgi:hypothetical protein
LEYDGNESPESPLRSNHMVVSNPHPSEDLLPIIMEDLEWNEALPEQQQRQWTSFKSALPAVDQIRIPRCIVPPTTIIKE